MVARDLKGFGEPLLAMQNTRFKLAECATEAALAQTFVDRCIERQLDGTLAVLERAHAPRAGPRARAEVGGRWQQGQVEQHGDGAAEQLQLEVAVQLPGCYVSEPVGAQDAADRMWALTAVELWQSLTGVRGWTADRYDRWLTDALRDAVLG